MDDYKTYHGIRIVPYRDKNGVIFREFEGIVIAGYHFDTNIEAIKLVKRNNGYFTDSFKKITVQDLEYSSGKNLLNYLLSEAKTLATSDEEIAISDRLEQHLFLLDCSWLNMVEICIPNKSKTMSREEQLALSFEELKKLDER